MEMKWYMENITSNAQEHEFTLWVYGAGNYAKKFKNYVLLQN